MTDSGTRSPGLDDVDARLRRARRAVIAAAALAAMVVISYPLNDDLRYVVGLLRVSGHSAASTFTHRPIAYRLIIDAQRRLPESVAASLAPPDSFARMVAFEAGFVALSVVIAAGAAVLLWAGLRRRFGSSAWAYALAAFAALTLTAPRLGEPDWYAPALATAGVGAALLGGRIIGPTASGLLLALAALVKFVTLPIALAAAVVIWMIDRRRGWISLLAAAVFGSLALAAIWHWVPWELRWMLDIQALQPGFWAGPETLHSALSLACELAVRWPVVLLVPAFFVRRSRPEGIAAGVVLALVCVPIVAQGEFWVYHAVALQLTCILLATNTVLRSRVALFWPVVASGVWTAVGTALPEPIGFRTVRFARELQVVNGGWLVVIALGWAIAFWVLQRRALSRPSRKGRERAIVLTGIAVLVAAMGSQTPWALQPTVDSRAAGFADAAAVRSVVGAATPVVYLAPGWTTYFTGNPTFCRYPSPLFLQRPTAAQVVNPIDRQENLRCLGWTQARWLVWRQDWLGASTMAADVRQTVDEYWDCRRSQAVAGYTLCPRRDS